MSRHGRGDPDRGLDGLDRPQGVDRSEVVAVTDGSVELGGRPVLRGVDLEVRRGEAVAVLGANGSGKSTLVRSVLGLVPLVRGQVRLFGDDLRAFHDWQRIGFVPQRAGASSGVPASVREVVSSGRLSRRRPFRPSGAADRDGVDRALDAVGLLHRARDGVSTLSGGQQQRVLIARALAGDPELLVLDEPTAGVDLPSQQALARALSDYVSRGATVVLVAHELGPLAPMVGRAVVMRDGRVAYDGPAIDAFTDLDDHHHHGLERDTRRDHAPVVDAPLDREETR